MRGIEVGFGFLGIAGVASCELPRPGPILPNPGHLPNPLVAPNVVVGRSSLSYLVSPDCRKCRADLAKARQDTVILTKKLGNSPNRWEVHGAATKMEPQACSLCHAGEKILEATLLQYGQD